jgi:hypothetical protein
VALVWLWGTLSQTSPCSSVGRDLPYPRLLLVTYDSPHSLQAVLLTALKIVLLALLSGK